MTYNCLGIIRASMMAAISASIIPTISQATTYDLTVDKVIIDTGEFKKEGIGYNGASPGPVLKFEEGEEVTINVTNNLSETTSIHWHVFPFRAYGTE